jgi:lysozyme
MDRKVLCDELIRDEGLRLISYQDSVGYWTIGVGHLLGERRRMTEVTLSEAMALLAVDIEKAEKLVYKYAPPASLGNDVRYRALVNMAFNLGNGLAGFKNFLAAVRKSDWMTAGVAMMDSKWAAQVGARAVRLRKMIETGEV